MSYFLKAKGLYTYRNELTVPEGSLEVADNIVIDEDGVIEPRRGVSTYGTSFDLSTTRAKQLISYKNKIIRHYLDTLELDTNEDGNFEPLAGSFSDVIEGMRLRYKEINGNLYLTSSSGIRKISVKSSSDLKSSSLVTNAGGVKAVDLEVSTSYSPAGFLPPQSKVAYRIVWGIKDANNNLILGSPSARTVLSNISEDINIGESSTIAINGVLTGSEYILFSSVDNDYYVWFNTGADTEPVDSNTLGRIGIEANVKNITTSEDAAIIANAISVFSDFNVDVDLNTITVQVNKSGDTSDISSTATNIVVSTELQGEVTSGDFSNATVKFTVPNDISTTDYFYQIFRTGIVTVSDGLTIQDIDPGDEMNLVLESGITEAEIAAKEVVTEDITPDSFRQSGAFLYTNPITGQGILQANEKPPVASDVELFRSSLFFSNTKTFHRLQFNLLSVTDFTAGLSEFIVSNSQVSKSYVFAGEVETTDIVCGDFANTLENSYILLNSARNETKYYVWFDKGTGTDPNLTGKIGIRINIEGLTTAGDISERMVSVLNELNDFVAADLTGSLQIVCVKNGDTIDASTVTGVVDVDGVLTTDNSATDIGTGWSITISTQGIGEDANANQVILSNQASVSQAIDETSRSLVKVINRDADSPVNAFYLSGPDDLPGIILLENKDLSDDPFYLSTNDSNIISKFNPELSLVETVDSVDVSAGIPSDAKFYSAGHTLTIGTSIYVEDLLSTPIIRGTFEVSDIGTDGGGDYFIIPSQITAGSDGSQALYFLADTVSDNEETPNRLYFSKFQQPEAVPLLNYIDVGSRNEPIERILALRDNLFVLKTDGIYIVTGSSAPNFSSRLLDSSVTITAPGSAAVINNQIYALSDDGVVAITETGVQVISRPIEDLIKKVTNSRYDFKYKAFGVNYSSDRSYLLWLQTKPTDQYATQCYRYNTFTQTWTRFVFSATCGLIRAKDDIMYLGDGVDNSILKERKTGTRKDYCDKEFNLSIPTSSLTSSVSGSTVLLSNITQVDVGDVLSQKQYLTLSYLKFVLRQLDLDPGLETDYISTINLSAGVLRKDSLDALNAKLVADDSSGTITPVVFSTDLETQKDQFNNMINELNDPLCDTRYKDYSPANELIEFEAVILSIDTLKQTVNLNIELPLVQGQIFIYKAFSAVAQYAPQHFGEPSIHKQIREGTFIMDQRTFYGTKVSYASDQSPNFEEIDFTGDSPGQFGTPIWGDFTWGGASDDVPLRTLIPLEKQRCRYLSPKFEHFYARERFRLLGISLNPRALSTRAYR